MMRYLLSLLLALTFVVGGLTDKEFAQAENTPPAATADVAKQGDTSLDKILDELHQNKARIEELRKQMQSSDGQLRSAFETKLNAATLEFMAHGLKFVNAVKDLKEEAPGYAAYQKAAIDILDNEIEITRRSVQRIRSQMQLPDLALPPAELASAYTKFFSLLDNVNRAYDQLAESLILSREYGIDHRDYEASLKEELNDLAIKHSVLIDAAIDELAAIKASVSVAPEDSELKARLAVVNNYVKQLAQNFVPLLDSMDKLGIATADYREQTLSVTGEITTEVVEISVITNLMIGWGQKIWAVMIEDGPDLIFKILLFIVIVFVFSKLAKFVKKLVQNAMEKSQLKFSELLRRMVVSIVGNSIFILGVLIAFSQVGISLGPLLAGLGVIGFVVGFALQDSLSNFASGLMILIYRPYDVGDLIEAAGMFGKVSHMSLVNTTIMTMDNQTIVVPNNKIWGDVVKNVTAQTRRRVDMMFGIAYTDDITKAEQVLQDIVKTHEKILAEPEPLIKLHELGDSSVNFIVRPWTNKDDYWDVYWDVTRAVKIRFDEEGLSIPFPQRDVHLYQQ
ncbi:MAG: mechanosensitive ion channel family protein [Deltaproteobacteria bacterium]|nr:mechanosensitive ion channel family protein [Deltaproteobacteria bacterium]